MSICFKCNKSIKPASLATTVLGEKYHPTCLTCAICDRPIWGKPFKKNSDGKIICEQPCTAPVRPPSSNKRPPSANNLARPSSAQRQQQIIQQQFQQSLQQPQQQHVQSSNIDLSKFKKPEFIEHNQGLQNSIQPYQQTNHNHNKSCKVCNQSVLNKRFVTFENGDILCQDCEQRLTGNIPRIKSAHYIACSICNKTVQGTKYFTEPNGDIVCDKCELTEPRCSKCRSLFKFNDPKRTLNNGLQFHEHCFDCSVCKNKISTQEFYQAENGLPMCLNCYEISKLPKCGSCNRHISEAYVIVDNNPIHEECFKCSECSSLLNKETGYFKNKSSGKPICPNCNLKLNGAKCVRCSNVIEKDGVTYANKDYHQHCFKCDRCGTELVKMKKTLTDKDGNGLYCEPCFVQNFAPKCNKCNQPIPPYIPGTQYEDKYYHKECFACARCKTSLAKTKFFKSGNILICERCY